MSKQELVDRKLSYTTKEAVEATGIYRQFLYLYRNEGLLNPVHLGKERLRTFSKLG